MCFLMVVVRGSVSVSSRAAGSPKISVGEQGEGTGSVLGNPIRSQCSEVSWLSIPLTAWARLGQAVTPLCQPSELSSASAGQELSLLGLFGRKSVSSTASPA